MPPSALRISGWRFVDELPQELALFEGVFWDARDTQRLRKILCDPSLVGGKSVLEIGTGSGLIALCCLRAGAHRVVATDVSPTAVANAAYNADRLEMADRLDLRLVPEGSSAAFSVIGADERFDLIVSNPPWEDTRADTLTDLAFSDEGFRLLRSLLDGLPQHLTSAGRMVLVYGCVEAIETAERMAGERGLQFRRHDDRELDKLPRLFLPGMVLEVRAD